MKSQSKKSSIIEAVVSNLVGFVMTVGLQLVFFPDQTIVQNLEFSGVLLLLHMIRSYYVRRGFNWWSVKKAKARKAEKRRLKQLEKEHEDDGRVRPAGEEGSVHGRAGGEAVQG